MDNDRTEPYVTSVDILNEVAHLSDGGVIPITHYLDADGDELTEFSPSNLVAIVAGPMPGTTTRYATVDLRGAKWVDQPEGRA